MIRRLFQKEYMHYQIMLIPGLLIIILMNLWPMSGIVIAFKNFNPGLGIWQSEWVGFENFGIIWDNENSIRIIRNTLIIAILKMAVGIIVPVVFALLLNEVRKRLFKRVVQTIVYLPHFLSWVILAGILRDMLSLDGIINKFIGRFGVEPIMFLGSNDWFRTIVIATDTWKEFGFAAIVYLAALTNINPTLYEAAEIDGANRWHKLLYITIPGLAATIVLLGTLSLQNILNAGFDQIFNLYNPIVYETGDIIDTYVYRVGLQDFQYEIGAAIGLFKSAISFILIVVAYKLASKFANYRIF
ncbi:ABC transporter permease [Paenibacillus sp. GCM10023252]|uniref:ABC transporter permease n=1 Tax=Paenibacillus sp. GCM10023252 TaxID=3252649 RepID=UPI0036211056